MATSWRHIFTFSSSHIFTNGKNLVYLFMRLPSWSETHFWNLAILPISLLQKREDFCVWWLNYVSDNFHLDCRIHKHFCKVVNENSTGYRGFDALLFSFKFFLEESNSKPTSNTICMRKKVYQYSSFSWTFI